MDFLHRLRRIPYALVPGRAVVRVRGGLNRGFRWVAGSSLEDCWTGDYEREKQAMVRRLVQPGMKVLDVGANVGFYTLMFSRLAGAGGRVWAFEPLAENADGLLRHLRLNEIRNATLLQAALSDRCGWTGFDIAESNLMGAISDRQGDYVVPVFKLDELVAAGQVPVPDVIKIDVEGAEARVLAGAGNLLRAHGTALLVALHGKRQKQLCLAFLRDAGYAVYELNGRPVDESEGRRFDEIVAMPGKGALPGDSF